MRYSRAVGRADDPVLIDDGAPTEDVPAAVVAVDHDLPRPRVGRRLLAVIDEAQAGAGAALTWKLRYIISIYCLV